jgi:hypothetical protein
MAWDNCLGNARLLGLHSPQHHANPLGKFSFGTSFAQTQESNYGYNRVEYNRVLPVEFYSLLHRQCAELLMARGVGWQGKEEKTNKKHWPSFSGKKTKNLRRSFFL